MGSAGGAQFVGGGSPGIAFDEPFRARPTALSNCARFICERPSICNSVARLLKSLSVSLLRSDAFSCSALIVCLPEPPPDTTFGWTGSDNDYHPSLRHRLRPAHCAGRLVPTVKRGNQEGHPPRCVPDALAPLNGVPATVGNATRLQTALPVFIPAAVQMCTQIGCLDLILGKSNVLALQRKSWGN